MSSCASETKALAAVQKKFVPVQLRVANWATTAPVAANLGDLELTQDELKTYRGKIEKAYDDAVIKASAADLVAFEASYEVLQQAIRTAQVSVIDHLRTLRTATVATSPPPAFKLDKIKLPQFSGNFHEWQSFRDLFETSIDKHPTLSGAEKMIHLKSCLIGDAAAIVASFKATEANYKEAWDLVIKRFDNSREIVFSHIKRFDDFKVLQSESASGLRSLSDIISECVRSLDVLNIPVKHWDLIMIYIGLKKLDSESRKQWSLDQVNDLPTLKEFLDFLEKRARALTISTSSSSKQSNPTSDKKKSANHVVQSSPKNIACLKCSGSHHLHKCPTFLNLSAQLRKAFVAQHNLCFNCFFKGHSAVKCPMKFSCKKCSLRHSTLIHLENNSEAHSTSTVSPSAPPESSVNSEEQVVTSTHCAPVEVSSHVVVMGTLIGMAEDSSGERQNCRLFVDPGSESNFVSEHCVDRLGLKRKKTCANLRGIGGALGGSAKGIVKLRLFSKVCDFSIEISALVLPKVTSLLPRAPCKGSWTHLKNLELSDPQFNRPAHVDILIGAEIAASIMSQGLIKGPIGSPVAQNTLFGWMLSGSVKSVAPSKDKISSLHVTCSDSLECVDSTLEKFWKLEEPESGQVPMSREDQICEDHFLRTHHRNSNGGLTVSLPFKAGAPVLGDSRSAAVSRFQGVERRLGQDSVRKVEYINYIRDYQNLNFMELVPLPDLTKPPQETYYMPHHMVVKESSATTKYRLVFDASAKSSSGVSLNDVLMTGPKIQVDLVPLLIRFRSHPVAISADIVKFYPQTKVESRDADFQRFVWRESPDQPLLDYRMIRLTFGVTTAPYLSIRCLHQLAEEESQDFPVAAAVVKKDFLVDNLLSGSHNVISTLQLQDGILEIMKRGNLKLRKWMSNRPELVQSVPPEDRDSEESLEIDNSGSVKTIGLLWQPNSDSFGVSIVVPDISPHSTKRQVLSCIARVFDPLGWLSPFTIRAKILMQEIWKCKLDWDSPLPPDIQKLWTVYCEELNTLKCFRIDRCLIGNISSQDISYELHGFCDASKLAYSACVYVRTRDGEGQSAVRLVMAKSKVAPLKTETIPRLELCGDVLLTKVMKTVIDSLDWDFSVTRCWTDSTIVLDWLVSTDKQPMFISNRINTINSNFPSDVWGHVAGDENPADCASRGISVKSFMSHPLWLHGPPWLTSTNFPTNKVTFMSTSEEPSQLSKLISDSSSFRKTKRIMAWCLRFFANSRLKRDERHIGDLSVQELNQALIKIVLCVQAESFPKEISQCQKLMFVKSSVKFLSPFLDKEGILRVGGRLQKSTQSFDQKHPMLLSSQHKFTDQLIRHQHWIHAHAGPQLLLAILREQFWIIRGLDTVRRITRKCIVCHRNSAKTATQIMGQLPFPRVNPARPFSQCGLDYAGPFPVCVRTGRNPVSMKSYVSVFICMATRAIHLEWVSDLSTLAFSAALVRFTSRRGLPADIYCDRGTNFVGAKNEMDTFLKFINSPSHKDSMSKILAEKGIRYHFNPPASPHHGGLWEAGVKSMKVHLKRVIGERNLSIEEFCTLLCHVESCLNSRPLTPLSSEPNDFSVLTPGHFLTGDSLSAMPQYDLTHLNIGRLSRWQAVQQLSQHFWRRWKSEYLSRL